MARERTLRELYQELINQGLIVPSMAMPGQFVYPSDQVAVPTITTVNAFDSTTLKNAGLGGDDAELEPGVRMRHFASSFSISPLNMTGSLGIWKAVCYIETETLPHLGVYSPAPVRYIRSQLSLAGPAAGQPPLKRRRRGQHPREVPTSRRCGRS